jgi:CheY-like chemotaxis protein
MRLALVVEDDPNLLEFYALCLRVGGWAVQTADNAELALQRVAQKTPDVILTDFAMPRGDGLMLAARMRTYLAGRKLPIVVVTANPERARRRVADGESLAACRIVSKPASPEALLAVATEAVEGCGRTCTGPDSPGFDPDLCGCGG